MVTQRILFNTQVSKTIEDLSMDQVLHQPLTETLSRPVDPCHCLLKSS
ncbi:hypothetical protein [Candidatus Cyanaurora vandensis]|nr:hypothetical protein [Candidatus Cyanaurora vandensis]